MQHGQSVSQCEVSSSGSPRNVGETRAVKLALCAALLAAAAGAQPSDGWRIDPFSGLPDVRVNSSAIDVRLDSPESPADGAGHHSIADRKTHRVRKGDSSDAIAGIARSGEYGFGEKAQGAVSTEPVLYFPDYVDGGGWSVQLVLNNVDPSQSAPVEVEVYDQQGRTVPRFFGSGNSFEIPARGSRVLRSPGGRSVVRGWIEVETGSAPVHGLLTYRHAESGIEVGVRPVPLNDHFALYVEESSDIGTGLAIFKPDAASEIEFQLRDEAGFDPLGRVLTLRNFQQRADVLPEWFAGAGAGFLESFRGLLFLRSTDGSGFAPMGLRGGKRQGSLSAVPLIPISGDGGGSRPPNPFLPGNDPAEGGTLYFPDFVDGGGWSVQLVLNNVGLTRSEPVGVEVYDQQGRPVPVFFDSVSSFEIPAGGSRVLRSPGGRSVLRGWIEVETDSASVHGLLTYRHDQTGIEVGVEAVPLRDHFALYVEESSDIGTGLAIFKPDVASEIEFQFHDEAGLDPLGGVLTQGNFQQRAHVLPDWFTGTGTGFLEDFRGLLFLRSADGSGFAPMGLRGGKRQGSLSAVPLIPIMSDGADKMYWAEAGEVDKIRRANLDGSGIEDLITTGLSDPRGLALDRDGGKMYWVDNAAGKIQRANLDGSSVEDLVTTSSRTTGKGLFQGLALDLGAGKMYWTDTRTGTIQRADLDGSGAEDLITAGLSAPLRLALDVGARKMYWTDNNTQKIQRANLDGTGIEDLLTGLPNPVGLALDLGAGKMYWTDVTSGKIRRANLNGTSVEDVVTTGLSAPVDLALDLGAGKMYWTDTRTYKIQRANLDGTSVEDLISTRPNSALGIALNLGDGAGGTSGSPPPDLVVVSLSVSEDTLTAGQSFELRAEVRNQGGSPSTAATLRYYQSNDAVISTRDTEVGTDAVSALAAAGSSAESIELTAPSSAGTYYYGACVNAVSGESSTRNNCSSGVQVTVSGGGLSDGAGKMYWTDQSAGKVQRANPDGSQVEDLVTGLSSPYDIAVDLAAGKMYWTEAGTDKIQRANLDGSGVEDLITGLDDVRNIVLDPGAGKMYWTDDGAKKILRANLDGTGLEDLVTGLREPSGIALDLGTGKMYWTDRSGNTIHRANLDGSGVEDLVTTGLSNPFYIALDLGAGKMYWTNLGSRRIQRANLDGSQVQVLVTWNRLGNPYGITLDLSAGKMYWTDWTPQTGKIQRANLDGTGVEDLVTGLEFPVGIALDLSGRGSGGGGGGTVGPSPDLVVDSPAVSDNTLTAGQSFELRATVSNRGGRRSAATTLRYYQSNDAAISTSDTQVGTDAVSALAAAGASGESIRLTAPSSAGTYYYGACVDPVSGEISTRNNCSSGVQVTISGDGSTPSTPKIYWTDTGTSNYTGKIQRANLDGSGIQDLVSGSDFPVDLSLDLSAGKFYWVEQSNIRRANLDGSGIQDLVTGVRGGISALALDLSAGKIYWLGYPPGNTNATGRIQRADLDGTGVQDLVTGLDGIWDLALDPSAGKMYWSELETASSGENTFKIRRANLDGTSVQDLVTGLVSIRHLALYPNADKIYWTEHDTAGSDATEGKIRRANVDGTGVEDLVTKLPLPALMALDLSAGKMYWTELGEFWTDRDGKIQRANLDGSGVQELVTGLDPTDLELDLGAGKMYWSDRGERETERDGRIQRANLDGTGVEDLVTGLASPESLVLDLSNRDSGGGGGSGTAGPSPDLVVDSPTVSDNTLTAGQSFDLRATVRNRGGRRSGATTLRYYQSSDATISTSDTQVGTDAVSALAAAGTGGESIRLTAPSSAGTYYYGACVDPVSGESTTRNNCSTGVRVTVSGGSTPKIYWTDTTRDRIQRANLDGTGIENLVYARLDQPVGLDVGGDKIYWVASGYGKIRRANLDGTGVQDLVTGLRNPYALDVGGGKIYWTELDLPGGGKIQRANLDGSGVEDLVTRLDGPYGLSLDLGGGKIYWTVSRTRKIQRANLDGSGIEDLVTGLDSPYGLDVGGNKIYWVDRGRGKIQRANLDGSGVEDLVTEGADGLLDDIALDLGAGKMYWTGLGTNKIQQANLDGTQVKDLVTGLSSARGLALDTTGAGKADADVGQFLATKPHIAAAMLWVGTDNRLKPYDRWPEALKAKLAGAVDQLRDGGATGLPEVMDNQAAGSLDDYVPFVFSKKDAEDLYVANVAYSLVLEMAGALHWSLDDLSEHELKLVLSSDGFYSVYRSFAGGSVEGYLTKGDVVPTSPEVIREFMNSEDLVGDSRYETVIRTIDWARRHLTHFRGGLDASNMEDHWGYRSFSPPLVRVLSGTTRGSDGQSAYFTAGCHGTNWFLIHLLRAVNIPVAYITWGGHAIPSFPSEALYLSHGDDPYVTTGQYSPPFPEPYPTSELPISEATYREWFSTSNSHEENLNNVGRRTVELSVEHLPQALLLAHCSDRAKGLSHAEGHVYGTYGMVLYWTVAELEAMRFWERMDAKIERYGGCSMIPRPHRPHATPGGAP